MKCRVCGNPIGLGAVNGCCSKKCNDSIDRRWGLWKKVKAVMLTVFILLAAYALLVMASGFLKAEEIHHEFNHRVLIVGVPSKVLVKVGVCDTEMQMTQVFVAHRDMGYSSAVEVWNFYSGQFNSKGDRICGVIEDYITITRVIETTSVSYPYKANASNTLVELTLSDGRVFYGILTRITVLKREGTPT